MILPAPDGRGFKDEISNRHRAKLIPSKEKRRKGKLLLLGFLAGLALSLAWPVLHITIGDNFHELLPGRIYRCAQLNKKELDTVISQHGIRTIVNLRGWQPGCDWYLDESRAAHAGNVSLEDVGLSAGRLPPVGEIRRLVRVLDRSEPPILVHCKQGIDRTGLVSALALLLYTDVDVAGARRQLALSYGHVALGRTERMGEFFDLYEGWLQRQNIEHASVHFRRWLETDYSAGPGLAKLELIEMPSAPPLNQPWSVRVRAHNASDQTWQFRPGSTAGIHCGYLLTDARGKTLCRDKAGLFLAAVTPGQSIELTLALPRVAEAGTYYLMVDMQHEQQQSYFYQSGSTPLVHEFVIAPSFNGRRE